VLTSPYLVILADYITEPTLCDRCFQTLNSSGFPPAMNQTVLENMAIFLKK